VCGEHHVVDIQKEIGDDNARCSTKDEEGRVGARLNETDAHHEGCEAGEPSSRHLTQTIEGTVEEADSVRSVRIDEPDRLLAVDFFLQVSMEECIGDVELVRWPLLGRDESQHCADGGGLNH
jgi:hypothetical protein